MSGLAFAFGAAACVAGGLSGCFAYTVHHERKEKARRRVAAYGDQTASARRLASSGGRPWGLRYAEGLTRRLFTAATEPIAPSVRQKRSGETRYGMKFLARSAKAGCGKDITVSAYCEAGARLMLAGALAGCLFGALFSIQMSVLLGVSGAVFGRMVMPQALRSACRDRAVVAERHLSEMLEVVSLGLRSGLTFDRSFALYGAHFDNDLAKACTKAYRRWALGLTTREEALAQMAESFDCEQLARVLDSIVRGLRFGSSLTDVLEDAAVQARATYRAALEERVAKAPVKMMLPTGTLILPAMLLLVLGPILLELANGF